MSLGLLRLKLLLYPLSPTLSSSSSSSSLALETTRVPIALLLVLLLRKLGWSPRRLNRAELVGSLLVLP